jgi:hypothetical protein
LDEEPLDNIAESHLLSPALIGRDREKAQFAKHFTRVERGQGNLVVLEGSAGTGRSRLANELVLDARVRGITTVRIDTFAHPGPNGVFRALAKSLIETAPAEAKETLAAHLPVAGLPEEARAQLEIGCRILTGSLETNRIDGSVHATIKAIDNHHTIISRQTAAGLRAAYHANRGEHLLFVRFQEEVDVLAAQAGATWRQDVLIARKHWWTFALCEDVMELKRVVRQLEEMSREVESLIETRDAAMAAYLAERGMYTEALERCRSIEKYVDKPNGLTMRYVGILARVLRAAGNPERARDVCETGLAALPVEEADVVCTVIGTQLEHALATAELGDHGRAVEMLDQMLEQQSSHDNPLIRGLTHKSSAIVALLRNDQTLFDQHLGSMKKWFNRTDNPALIAQCQKMAEQGRKAGLLKDTRSYSVRPASAQSPDLAAVNAAFDACRGPAERLQTAVDLILDKSRAERGYLYIHEPDGLAFSAPVVGIEPPEELRLALERRIRLSIDDDLETMIVSHTAQNEFNSIIRINQDAQEQNPKVVAIEYSSLLLVIPKEDDIIVVGIIALVKGDEPIKQVDSDFLIEIARGIYHAGDVQTVYFGAGAS